VCCSGSLRSPNNGCSAAKRSSSGKVAGRCSARLRLEWRSGHEGTANMFQDEKGI
jgi:hypothetical protein